VQQLLGHAKPDLTGCADTEGRDFCDDIHEFIG
jgi:hypothetical protein